MWRWNEHLHKLHKIYSIVIGSIRHIQFIHDFIVANCGASMLHTHWSGQLDLCATSMTLSDENSTCFCFVSLFFLRLALVCALEKETHSRATYQFMSSGHNNDSCALCTCNTLCVCVCLWILWKTQNFCCNRNGEFPLDVVDAVVMFSYCPSL